MSTVTAVKKKMTDFSKVKVGTKLSETQFYTVASVNPAMVKGEEGQVEVLNDLGQEITLDESYVESLLVSADQFNETKPMSRTDIINLFLSSTNVACTVNFNKKVDEKEVLKELKALYPNSGGKILSKAEFEKAVTKNLADALEGEERTMVGRHYGRTDEFGRIKFVDMQAKGGYDEAKDYDTRTRLVDPRTINWIIVRGVKYEVK